MEEGSIPPNNTPLLEGEQAVTASAAAAAATAPDVNARSLPKSNVSNLEPLLDGNVLPSYERGILTRVPLPLPLPLQPISSSRRFQEESYDLSFIASTIEDEEEEDDFPPLPPLISYCSYVKYFCCFSKWLLPVIIMNIVAFEFPNWLPRENFDPFDDYWMSLLLPAVLICTSIWLFLAAKVIERDVEKVDQMAQYEQGRLSEEGDGDDAIETGGVGVGVGVGVSMISNEGTPPTSASDINLNYEHIYGQVSRKIDSLLTPNDTPRHRPTRSRRSTAPQTTTMATGGTSFLTNLCYALWALTLAAGVYKTTAILIGKLYVEDCSNADGLSDDQWHRYSKSKSNININSSNSSDIDIFVNTSQFPTEVSNWIVEKKKKDYRQTHHYGDSLDDAYSHYRDGTDDNIDDDCISGDYRCFDDVVNVVQRKYDDDYSIYSHLYYSFPTAKKSDVHSVAIMEDGTVFMAAQAPPSDDHDGDNYMVLAEVSSDSSTIKYHHDIFNPRMFIPVQKTIIPVQKAEDNEEVNPRARRYCFTGTERSVANQLPWFNNVGPKTLIHCIVSMDGVGGTTFTIQTATIQWKDKDDISGHLIFAASYEGLVLISNSNFDHHSVNQYQEVQQVDPLTMETSMIYHHYSINTTDTNRGDVSPIYFEDDDAGEDDYQYVYKEGEDDYKYVFGEDDYYNNYPISTKEKEKRKWKCINRRAFPFPYLASIVVLGLASCWLIVREGVASGAIPFVFALVSILLLVFKKAYFFSFFCVISLTAGTLFLHCMIFFGGCRCFPAWIGRDVYTWTLYGWMLAFIAPLFVFDEGDAYFYYFDDYGVLALFYLAFTGIILGHPIIQIMGYSSIFVGLIMSIHDAFYYFDIVELFIPTLMGLGLIVVGNWISANRKFGIARCRPIVRGCRSRWRR